MILRIGISHLSLSAIVVYLRFYISYCFDFSALCFFLAFVFMPLGSSVSKQEPIPLLFFPY